MAWHRKASHGAAGLGRQGEARHNDVVVTIQRLFEKGVLRESRKTTRTHRPERGGRPTEVYDLTKRDTLVVVSGYNDELRARIIDKWEELERAARRPVMPDLNNPATLRLLLADYANDKIALEEQVAELAPKAEALDRIATADGSMCITDAAKTLQVQPKAAFQFLRAHRWIYSRQGGGDIAYQDKLASGLLEHKTTTIHRSDGSEKVTTQVRVTPKGLARLAKELQPGREGGMRKEPLRYSAAAPTHSVRVRNEGDETNDAVGAYGDEHVRGDPYGYGDSP